MCLQPQIFELFTLGYSHSEILSMYNNIFPAQEDTLTNIMLSQSEASLLKRFILSEKMNITKVLCSNCQTQVNKCYNCKLAQSATSMADIRLLETLAKNVRLRKGTDGRYFVECQPLLPKNFKQTFHPSKNNKKACVEALQRLRLKATRTGKWEQIVEKFYKI